MYPIQRHEGDRGVGMGHGKFVEDFAEICQSHMKEGRARAFAFVFYDMHNTVLQNALIGPHGFDLLNDRTGSDITLFYLNDFPTNTHLRNFNRKFMTELGIQDQASPPCIVFFRVHNNKIEDVSIYNIDAHCTSPVLVAVELAKYVDETIKNLNAEGDLSALVSVAKAVTFIPGLPKLVDFVEKLRTIAV